MSISEAIAAWLYTNETIEEDKTIDTDQLAAEAAAYGLYKAPQTVVKEYVNGTREVTSYYQFLIRQSSAQETTRQQSQQWLEAVETWVRTQDMAGVRPSLGTSRECTGIAVATSYTLQEATENNAVYYLSIAITYTE